MFKAEVVRRINPVKSSQFNLDYHPVAVLKAETSESLARQCIQYSRDSLESEIRVDQNLYYIIYDGKFPIAYGSPQKYNIKWNETSFS